MDDNLQRQLLRELAFFVEPLGPLTQNPDALFDFLYGIGWDVERILGDDAARFVAAAAAIAGTAQTLVAMADDPPDTLAELRAALNAARTLFSLVDALPAAFGGDAPPEIDALPSDVIEALTLVYLGRRAPRLYRLLELVTVIQGPDPEPDGTVRAALRDLHETRRLRLDRLTQVLRDPHRVFAEEYWPDGIPDRARAAEVARRLFPRLLRFIYPEDVTERGRTRGFQVLRGEGGGPPELSTEDEQRLAAMLTLSWVVDDEELGLSVGILSAQDGGPGVFVVPFGGAEFLLREGDLLIRLHGELDAPGFQVTARGLAVDRQDGKLDAQLDFLPLAGKVTLLSGGTGLEIGNAFVTVGVGLANAQLEARVMVSIVDSAFVVAKDGADGFLGRFLPATGSRIPFELTVGWSNLSGFHIRGSGSLETRVPTNIHFGPVTATGLTVALGANGVSIGADLTVELGPVTVVVRDIGLRLAIAYPRSGGNAGPLDLTPEFKPPSGAGIELDAGVVTGGGFLRYDPARGEYAGMLELEFTDLFSLKGIGLITTRMPDGSSGFSLLVVLTAHFPEPGLQMGFGFRLLAVGGIIGVNRSVHIPALMDGVRSGGIESVMFPDNVIANAPRILSDLRTFFPPREDRFLIGPMAKLAWGNPALLTASLAVVVEIPGNIAFVGVLRVALPRPETPILLLQVNFAGVVEPDEQRMYFTATLFESRILHLHIDGDMGVLIGWGNDPNLILTVGGFHPSYPPPPLPFPTPRRISIDILREAGARIGITGYFAVTSNTVQFGADADIYFKFSSFRVEGNLGIDALFQISPFAFAAEVRAGVSLKAFGVGCFSIKLRFALEGPTPWRVHGRGSVSLLFFDISANFDITWGAGRDTTLPPVRVLPILAGELSKPDNWQTRSPSNRPLVTLRDVSEAREGLVLHPMGTLFVRQRAVPLDVRLDRFGAQRPSDVSRLRVTVTGGRLVKVADARELFAPAQFQDFDDAEKMSRPAFQRQNAGLELAPDGNALFSARAIRRTARYEEVVIDPVRARDRRRFVTFPAALFTHFLRGNSISRSVRSHTQRNLVQPFRETLEVTGETFSVAHVRDNTAAAAPFPSEAAARDFLARNPALAGSTQVIPTAEVLS